MSREVSSNDNLEILWNRRKENPELLWKYIDEFLILHAANIDKDLTLYSQGFNAEGPHLSYLPDNLLPILNRVILDLSRSEERSDLLKIESIVKCLIVICRNYDNIPFIASCDFVGVIIVVASKFIKKYLEESVDNGFSNHINFFHSMFYLFECMYDPYFTWKNKLAGKASDLSKATYKPSLLHVEVVPFFYDWFHLENLESIPKEVCLRFVNVFGSIMSGAQHNALMAISPATLEVLMSIVLNENLNSQIKRAALYCVVQMIHTLHASSPDQRQVEVSAVIDTYIKSIGKLCISAGAQQHLGILIMMTDMFEEILKCNDSISLQVILAASGCCDYLVQLLDRMQLGSSNAQIFAASVINAIKLIVARSNQAKKIFAEEAGYGTLYKLLERLGQPSKELLRAILNLATEYSSSCPSNELKNAEAVLLLLQWLPGINCSELQQWLAEMLLVICCHNVPSKARCCEVSVIGSIVNVLQQHSSLHLNSLAPLLRLLEKLGSYSITAYELKQIIRLWRPNTESKLMSYTSALMHTLSTMARKDGYDDALHYFDFQGPSDGICISGIRKWPGAAYSFHAWVRLNHKTNLPANTLAMKNRYQLYSFYNGSGTGFEAFFTEANVLMVAVCTKKDYQCLPLTEHPFIDNQWHCIDICHSSTRRPFGNSQICIYIDGHLKLSKQLKFPSLSEAFTQCRIASAGLRSGTMSSLKSADDVDKASYDKNWPFPLSFSIPAPIKAGIMLTTGNFNSAALSISVGTQDEIWGHPCSLQGQLGSVSILHEVLTSQQVKLLYDKGPNCLTLFNPEYGEYGDLSSKLVLRYDPKACNDSYCIDLAPGRLYDGYVKGQKCVTFDIKDVINSIGGLPVLFPLLEYAGKAENQISVDFLSVMTPSPSKESASEDLSEEWEVLPSSCFSDNKLEQNLVAGFMVLLRTMIQNSKVNYEHMLLKNGAGTIGALLLKVPASYIDINLLMSVQLLVEGVANMTVKEKLQEDMLNLESASLLYAFYHYLVFDFRIWSRAPFAIRIGHIQYLSTIIKDNKKYFRKKYGVQYILDMIRGHCVGNEISQIDMKTIRHSLFSLIKYFVLKDITFKELSAIVAFVASINHEEILREMFELLQSLIDNEQSRSDQIFLLLFEPSCAEYFYVVLLNEKYSNELKVNVLKFLSNLLRTTKVYEKSKARLRLTDIGFCGLTSLLQNMDISSDASLTMLDMVLLTDLPSSYLGALSLNQFFQSMDVTVKHEAAKKLMDRMLEKSTSASIFAKVPAWEDSVLRLLIKKKINAPSNSSFPSLPNDLDELDNLADSNDSNIQPRRQRTRSESITVAQSPLFQSNIFNFDPQKLRNSSATDSQFSSNEELSNASGQDNEANDTLSATIGKRASACASVLSQSLMVADASIRSSLTSLTSQQSSSSGVGSSSNQNATVESKPVCDAMQNVSDILLRETENLESEDGLVSCILNILFTLMWKGIDGSDKGAWQKRGQILACINMVALSNELYVSHLIVKRRLLEMCLQACINDLKNAGQANASHTENAIQLMKFVHDFIFSDGSEDGRKLSVQLLDSIVELLDILLVFDESSGESEWSEMAKIGMSIMLISVSNPQLDICSLATARLHALIQTRQLNDLDEACYIMAMLNKALCEQSNDNDHYPFLVPVMKALLEKVGSHLNIQWHAPNLPSTSSGPSFFEQFQRYFKTDEWHNFISKIIKPHEEKYIHENHKPAREEKNSFWIECYEAIMVSAHSRNREIGEDKLKFLSHIVEPFHILSGREDGRYHNYAQQLKQQNVMFRRRWLATRHFLFSPRGSWESLSSSRTAWKVSHHENFNRMRLKLTIHHNFDDHLKASRLRDNYGMDNLVNNSDSLPPMNLAKEAVVNELQDDSITDDEVTALTSEDVKGPDLTGKEKLILSEKCELVTLMSVVEGTIEITTSNVYFFDKSPIKEDGDRMDFKWSLSMLREVHLRRYNLRRSALEFFLVDQTNYFLNFSTKTRNKIYGRIVALKPQNLFYYGSRGPAELLKASGLVQKWVQREISNFEYLIQLNTIAGRTYNDLSQYPVFPWILADYKSEELDLDKESSFRNLSRPIGINNPKNIAEVKAKYEQFEDVTGMVDKFHFGTHYSNSAGVLHYLVRLEPFTSLHIDLQGNRFDVADRQFHSIEATWNMLMDNPNDVKELIPEFFYLPEFLSNINGFDLGKLQSNNETVNDVILPKWAASPEDFIYQHRKALESDYVSNNLHDWIDLIFGFKQRGPDAVEALNVFYYCSYEGAVDLDAISDPIVREATEGMINNFGQTPCQLLKEPHPKRMSKVDANKLMLKLESKSPNILWFPDQLKAFCIELFTNGTCASYINVPKSQSRSFIQHGMPDAMITVTDSGVVGVHSWLPYDKSISNYFTFEKDPTLTNNKTIRRIASPFQPGLDVCSKLFAVTHDAKLLISGGHWDNSIRVYHLSKNKLVSHVIKHTDVVTCLDLDSCGNHLITGSRDTTCKIWELRQNTASHHVLNKKPLQTLYGHNDEVTCVAIAIELDMAVSGSKDGTINVYSVREGQYFRTLRPSGADDLLEVYKNPQIIEMLALSEQGHICIYCCDANKASDNSNSLHIYSINGKHIAQEVLSDAIMGMAVSGEYLITGSSTGALRIAEIHGLRLMTSMSLHVPITCVSPTTGNSHILATLNDGKLIIVGLERVSEPK